MTGVRSERTVRWARGVGLLAVGALAWDLLVPEDLFWMVTAATGLIGAVVATVILVRIRSSPTLAEVIARAESSSPGAPASVEYAGGAGLRSRG